MAFVYADFVAAFPEFSNDQTYPEASFNFWQGIANLRLDPCRWGALLDNGAMLFVAHYLKEQAQNIAASNMGNGLGVGKIQGPQTAKSIDKLSESLDARAATIEGGGDWNSTQYGVQFFQLMMIVGSGGRQF